MWPPLPIGVVLPETPIYYKYFPKVKPPHIKKVFPQIKRFENDFEKKFPDLKFSPLILAENPVFP